LARFSTVQSPTLVCAKADAVKNPASSAAMKSILFISVTPNKTHLAKYSRQCPHLEGHLARWQTKKPVVETGGS
jgi:hypothetical protein